MEFLKSLLSRKFIAVILGGIGCILYPDSSVDIITLIGIYCGANVAQKFSLTTEKVNDAVKSAQDLIKSIQ